MKWGSCPASGKFALQNQPCGWAGGRQPELLSPGVRLPGVRQAATPLPPCPEPAAEVPPAPFLLRPAKPQDLLATLLLALAKPGTCKKGARETAGLFLTPPGRV